MILANTQREIPDLLVAVEQRGSCAARLVQTVPVRTRIGEEESADVVVHVYELQGCAMTNRAYAWFSDAVYTALDIGPIRSPSAAVHATVADRDRQSKLASRGLREAAFA
jgi:hypothetical protein